jgi:hypothetical protein
MKQTGGESNLKEGIPGTIRKTSSIGDSIAHNRPGLYIVGGSDGANGEEIFSKSNAVVIGGFIEPAESRGLDYACSRAALVDACRPVCSVDRI